MGKTVTIEVLGVDKIVKDIQTVAQANRFKREISLCTAIVESTAKSLCPKDTGRLVNSIHMSVREDGANTVGKVSTNVEYAPYVEFGTGQRGAQSNYEKAAELGLSYSSTRAGQVAQPYMYPALKRNEQSIKKRLEDAIRNEI